MRPWNVLARLLGRHSPPCSCPVPNPGVLAAPVPALYPPPMSRLPQTPPPPKKKVPPSTNFNSIQCSGRRPARNSTPCLKPLLARWLEIASTCFPALHDGARQGSGFLPRPFPGCRGVRLCACSSAQHESVFDKGLWPRWIRLYRWVCPQPILCRSLEVSSVLCVVIFLSSLHLFFS